MFWHLKLNWVSRNLTCFNFFPSGCPSTMSWANSSMLNILEKTRYYLKGLFWNEDTFSCKIWITYESQDHIEIWNFRNWLPLSRPATRTLRIWCSGENTERSTQIQRSDEKALKIFGAGYPSFPYILTNVLISRCSSMKKPSDYITQFQRCKPTSILFRVCILWLLYKSKFHFIIQPSQASNCGCPRHGWSKHAGKKSPKQSSCIIVTTVSWTIVYVPFLWFHLHHCICKH